MIAGERLLDAGVLDGLAAECAAARVEVNGRFEEAKRRARAWDLPDRKGLSCVG